MSKPTIILDIDQTLISAEPANEFDFTKNKDKMSKFRYVDMEGYYIVFERPYLQEFLDYIFKNFRVGIWTAATQSYATFVTDKIILNDKPSRQLEYIFFSYHCGISEKKASGTKDLTCFWDLFKLSEYGKDNVFILDDYDEVYKTQPNNCIPAKPFYFNDEGSENDTYLKDLIKLFESMNGNFLPVSKIIEQVDKQLPLQDEKVEKKEN